MPTLLDQAYHWEKTSPDRIYMTQPLGGGRLDTFSWKRTLDEARRMAAHLQSLGLPPKSNIAILSKNCAHFILSDLAIWMAGHVSVALYPTLNAETVRYILEHSESKLLFLGKLDSWDDMKPGVAADMPMIAFPSAPPSDAKNWDDIIKSTDPVDGAPNRDPKELAIIVYTSGSTGRPKGVMHSFDAMYTAATGAKDLLDTDEDDRMLSYLPLAHVFERCVVESGSLALGFQVFFAESLDTFVDDIKRARPTIFVSVPRLWLKFQLGVFQKMPKKKLDRMLKIPILSGVIKKKLLEGLGLQDVHKALTGSAPIPPDLLDWYRSIGLELLEGYGMSEDFAYSHVSLPGKSRVGYVGNPMPGVDVKLSDEGEVLIKSPANMMGYYKEPEMTAACYTEDGYFKTGDRGERDSDGRLKITGRVKEIFKTSKGKYVAPAPIENLLNASPYVEMSCVTGSGEPQPHAVAVPAEAYRAKAKDSGTRQEITAALEALRKEINASVDPHEQLAFIAIAKDDWQIENGFLTPTMKIKRDIIEKAYSPKSEQWYAEKKPVIWEQ